MRLKMEQQDLIKIAIPLVAVPLTSILLFRHHFADHNQARRLLTFKNMDECMVELEKIEQATALKIDNDWTLYQNLMHCTQSIMYSMIGFPENKPKLFQKTIGSLIFNQFEHQGYMRHNRNEPIPGATEIKPAGNSVDAAIDLRKAVLDFENFDRELKPHFAYGKLTKLQFANAHCMHMADHFAIMTY
ncbi:MAG: DUF1569 domain-containing protein [Saprospiraceae bacterium]